MQFPVFTRNALAGPEQPSQLQDDWVGRLMHRYAPHHPYAGGRQFRDDIFQKPPNERAAQSLDFDRMGTNEQPWVTDGFPPGGF